MPKRKAVRPLDRNRDVEEEEPEEESRVPISVLNAIRNHVQPRVADSKAAEEWQEELIRVEWQEELIRVCYRAARQLLHDVLLDQCGLPLVLVAFLEDGWMDTVALYYRFVYESAHDDIENVWNSPEYEALKGVDPIRVCLVSATCACRDCRLRQHLRDGSSNRIRYDVCQALPEGDTFRRCPVCEDQLDGDPDSHILSYVDHDCRRTYLEDTLILPSFPMAFPVEVVGAIMSCLDCIVDNALVSSRCKCCPPFAMPDWFDLYSSFPS